MRSLIFFCSVLLSFTFSSLFCGETTTISLSNAIELGIRNNLDIRQAEKDVRVAEYQLYESYADLFLPQVSASGSFSYMDPDSVAKSLSQLKIGNQTYIITNQFPDNYSGGLSISKPIFQGFKYWDSKEIQLRNLELAKTKYSNMICTTRFNIQTNFYQLLLGQQNLFLYQTADKNLKARLDYVEDYYKRGQTNEMVYLTAKYAYKSDIPLFMKAQDDFDSAKLNLCILTGISNSSNIIFAGDYYALTNISLNYDDKKIMLTKVISNDINLKTTQITIATTKLNQSITDFSRYPSLTSSFDYNYNYRKDYSIMNGNGRSWQSAWQLGLNLNVPIEDWLPVSRSSLTVAENDNTLQKLDLTQTEQIKTLEQQFVMQFNQLRELKATMDSLYDNETLAKRSFELMKEQFNLKLAIILDLNDYQLTFQQSEFGYWQAVYNYAAAILKLKNMMGE